jgi:hypothetical protein
MALGLVALLLGPGARAGDEARDLAVEAVEYRGWAHNLRLSNGDAELIVTLDVGPRVLSYRLAGGKNVFKEYDEQLGKAGEAEWMIRGGHRLWTAPEDTTRTYAPDNGPVAWQPLGPGRVRVTPPPDAAHGIQKEMDVHLEPTGSGVTVVHRIRNVGAQPTELAPWALSVMAPGGVEVIPLPPKRPHPGSPKNARTPADFAPNQLYVLWPYTDFQDPRWGFGAVALTLRQGGGRGPTKLGLAHRLGWVGYLNAGTLFVKRFAHRDGVPYPDGGCNFETFTSEGMLEMESLGPLVRLAPGQAVEHTERWELIADVEDFRTEEQLRTSVLARVKGSAAD